jgi:2-polyprenyl-3-methyl-5-hydroxy-6-metoxy-1,4-benzoquinol methylase
MSYPFIHAFESGSTKSDKIEFHGYQRFYPWFLGHLRDQPINLLEIGLWGNESIKLWKSYLPKARIYGIDINPKEMEGATLFKVDQSSREELTGFKEKVKVLEFVVSIDDGSHVPDHQLLTFRLLWEKLKPGGIYIIEDIETSYWGESTIYDYQFNSRKANPIELFKRSVDHINKEFIASGTRDASNLFLDQIEMISFGANCIILIKKDDCFSRYYDRSYRYRDLIDIRKFSVRVKKKLSRYLGLFH